jgi:hypothetical protein
MEIHGKNSPTGACGHCCYLTVTPDIYHNNALSADGFFFIACPAAAGLE